VNVHAAQQVKTVKYNNSSFSALEICLLRLNACKITQYQVYITINLTLWEPVYDIFVPRYQPKNSSFRLPYQRHSSSADFARKLLIGSNG